MLHGDLHMFKSLEEFDRWVEEGRQEEISKRAAMSKPRGVLKEAASALGAGVVSTGESIAGAGEMIGIPGARGAREYLQEVGEAESLARPEDLQEGTIVEHPERLADWRWWVRSLGENIPNMAAMMLPGGLAWKGAKAAGWGYKAIKTAALSGAFSGAATVEAGAAYTQAKKEMDEFGYADDVIERVATAEGLIVGTANGILEMLPFDNLFLRSTGASGIIRRIVRQAVFEGSTEMAQETVSLAVEQWGHQPDVELKTAIGRVLESGIIGGVLGGGAGAVFQRTEDRGQRTEKEKDQPISTTGQETTRVGLAEIAAAEEERKEKARRVEKAKADAPAALAEILKEEEESRAEVVAAKAIAEIEGTKGTAGTEEAEGVDEGAQEGRVARVLGEEEPVDGEAAASGGPVPGGEPGEREVAAGGGGEGEKVETEKRGSGETEIKEKIDAAANEAATSPKNDLPEPTEEQKEKENYKMGHPDPKLLHGLDISIENPKGSIRKGKSKAGVEWQTKMQAHYGHINGTEGADSSKKLRQGVDVFIGETPESEMVFIVNQVSPDTGKFDEHKAMLNYPSEEDARKGYLGNYEKGWKGLGSIVPMKMDEFKTWLKEGDTTKEAKGTRGTKGTEGEKGRAAEAKTEPTAKEKAVSQGVASITGGKPTAAAPAEAKGKKEEPTPAETKKAGEYGVPIPQAWSRPTTGAEKKFANYKGFASSDEGGYLSVEAWGETQSDAENNARKEFERQWFNRDQWRKKESPELKASEASADDLLAEWDKQAAEMEEPKELRISQKELAVLRSRLKIAQERGAMVAGIEVDIRRYEESPKTSDLDYRATLNELNQRIAEQEKHEKEVKAKEQLPSWAAKKVGENRADIALYEDKDGNRVFLDKGFVTSAPRPLVSGGQVLKPYNPEQLYKAGRKEFLTKEELEKFKAEGKPVSAGVASITGKKQEAEAKAAEKKEFKEGDFVVPNSESGLGITYRGRITKTEQRSDGQYVKIFGALQFQRSENFKLQSEVEEEEKKGAKFKKGDRVVITGYGEAEPRHGEISDVRGWAFRPLFGAGGQSATEYDYDVKTDQGATWHGNDQRIVKETERPEKVVPDILRGNTYMEPDYVLRSIASNRRTAKENRASAGRAKKASRISGYRRQAAEADQAADDLQAAFDEWAKKYPEEAAKYRKTEGGGQRTATEKTVAGATETLRDYGIDATKTTTKNGKPVWEVSGNTKPYAEEMKKAGGRWYGPKKVWSFYGEEDPTARILEALPKKEGTQGTAETKGIPNRGVASITGKKPEVPAETEKPQTQEEMLAAVSDFFKGDRPVVSWTFKQSLEEFNRKTVESLSYVGKLVSREELANGWVKVTYEKVGEKPVTPQVPTAGEKARETVDHVKNAVDKFKAINKILGEKGSLGGPVEQGKYDLIRPLLKEAWDEIVAAGKSAKEFVQLALQNLSPKGRPYFEKFVREEISHAKPEPAGTEEAEAERHPDREAVGRAGVGGAPAVPPELPPGSDLGTVSERPAGAGEEAETGGAEGGVLPGAVPAGGETGAGPDRGEGAQPGGPKRGATKRAPSGRAGKPRARLEPQSAELAEANQNHRIEPDDELVPRGDEKRIQANIRAIKLVKQLISEERNPTKAEKKILAQYVGWGKFSERIFNKEFDRYVREYRGKTHTVWAPYGQSAEKEYTPEDFFGRYGEENERKIEAYKKWETKYGKELHPLLGGMLTEEEWKAAEASTLNAHYTSRQIISSMWDLAERLGFKKGTVLEPAAGVGHFFGLMPESVAAGSKLIGVELDTISGAILSKLYPQADIRVKGFEESNIPDNSVDLVITNVPFGRWGIFDARHPDYSNWSIHDYFLARSIDTARPGGLVIAITSHWTMDKVTGGEKREYFARKADLVGAIRLPNTAFQENAGTEVVTDILVFRKKDNSFRPEILPFRSIKSVPVPEGKDKSADVNEYFADHPEMVLGRHSLSGTMRRGGDDEYTLLPDPAKPLDQGMRDAISALPENIHGYVEKTAEQPIFFASEGAKDGVLYEKDGKLYMVEDGKYVQPTYHNSAGKLVHLSDAQIARARRYLELKAATKALINKMNQDEATDEEIKELQGNLNDVYDRFVKEFNYLNHQSNGFLRLIDGEFPITDALEQIEQVIEKDEKGQSRYRKVFHKIGMFFKRTIFPFKEPEAAESVEDGVNLSLIYRGNIDLHYIAKVTGKDQDGVRKEILESGAAYLNPVSGLLEASDEYLSGNVVRKLREAEAAVKENKDFEKNVKALKGVQPKFIDIEQAHFRLGTPWIPTESVEGFLEESLGVEAKVELVRTKEFTRFHVRITNDRYSTKNEKTWGVSWKQKSHEQEDEEKATGSVRTLLGTDLIEDALNLKIAEATDTIDVGDRKSIQRKNKNASIAAQDKQNEIQDAFRTWARGHKKWASEYAKLFNENENQYKVREFPVPTITHFPNASQDITLRDEQKRAVMRGLRESALFAYGVGTGKTYIIITTAMEMRRIGTARKPCIVVQNSTLGQYASSFRRLYPGATVLIPNEKQRSAKQRNRLMMQIAQNDWDAIIIPKSFANMIADDPAREQAYVQEQIDMMEEARWAAEQEEGKNSFKVKDLNAAIRAKEQHLKKLLARHKDNVLTFEQLGIDALIIDEAHDYKRSDFFTKMDKVRGIDRGSSQRSASIYLKIRHVQEKTGGKNVILATGTPISNTMAELWTMLRYVRPDILDEFNSGLFDDFAGNFGEVEIRTEETAVGTFKDIQRFSKYVNGRALLTMWRAATDVLLTKHAGLDLPAVKGGKPEMIKVARSKDLRVFMRDLRETYRAWENLSGKEKRLNRHVPIVLYGLAKKASVDLRLVNPIAYGDDPESKLNTVVKTVHDVWKKSTPESSTQLVFLDIYHDSERKFDAHEDIKQKLIKLGIPEEEIAVVEQVKGDARTEAMWQKVREGKIRVAIGHREKLGVGVDVPQKLIAVHHVDPPQRPMDYEQSNGRIVRQGNENPEVMIFNYGVEKTLDSVLFDRLAMKQFFIDQVLTGQIEGDTFDDPFTEEQMNFSAMQAALIGDPAINEKVEVDAKYKKLKIAKRTHEQRQSDARYNIRSLEEDKIPRREGEVATYRKEAEAVKAARADAKFWKEVTLPDGKAVSRKEALEWAQAQWEAFGKETKDRAAKITVKDWNVLLEAHKWREAIPEWTQAIKIGHGFVVNFESDVEFVTTDIERNKLKNKDTVRPIIDLRWKLSHDDFGVMTVSRQIVAPSSVQQAIGAALDAPAEHLAYLERNLQKDKESLAEYKEIAKETFDKEEELAATGKRQRELEDYLRTKVIEEEDEDLRDVEGSAQGILDNILRDADEETTGAAAAPEEEEEAAAAKERAAIDITLKKGERLYYFNKDGTFYPVAGRPVDVVPYGEFFVHKEGKSDVWEVREVRSGFKCGQGNSIEEAVNMAISQFERVGEEKGKQLIDEAVEESGESPAVKQEQYSVAGRERARARKQVTPAVTIDDVRKIFKGQPVVLTPEGEIKVFPREHRSVTIKSVEQITPNSVALNIAYGVEKVKGEIAGKYKDGEISLQRDVSDKWTLTHESYHFMEDAGIVSHADVGILRAKIRSLENKGKWTPVNPKDIGGGEDRAAWVTEQLKGIYDVKTLTGQILQKIRQFIDRVMAAFGIRTAGAVTRDIETGRVFEGRGQRTEDVGQQKDLFEVKVSPTAGQASAVFLGYQETGRGGKIALFNIEGGERDGSTVSADTLKELGIDVPEVSEEQEWYAIAKQPPGKIVAQEIEQNRSFVNKIFELRDVAKLRIQNQVSELQREVQKMAGKASRRKFTLGFAHNKELKRSMASDQLDRAMMVYRDLQTKPEKADEFKTWAEQKLKDKDTSAKDRLTIKGQLTLLDQALNLTQEQKDFAMAKLGELFEKAFELAKRTKIIQTHRDNYVRRLWNLPEGKEEQFTGSGSGYGFSVYTTAAKKRTLPTILDGWMAGYDLKVKGLTNSYEKYLTELATIIANKAFIQRGTATHDTNGNAMFTTTRRAGYKPLKASGFQVWRWAGEAEVELSLPDEEALAINTYGRKFFATPPDRIPETWAVYSSQTSKRALRVFDNEDDAKEFADNTKLTRIEHRRAADVSTLFEKQPLYAPGPIADMINKMTATETLFNAVPGLNFLLRLNAGLKSWILMSSFFHHMAGSRSWVFAIHHGWKGVNPVKAYKAGLQKIEDLHPLVELGVKNGLTLGDIQDWSEMELREKKGFTERLVNYLGMEKTSKVIEYGKFRRESWADSLFKKYFAGLKAEAFVIEYTHELQKATEKFTAGKIKEPPNPDRIAERVARLMNADFGGLHLQRMGRNPTLQKVARMLLLAPDWTESNFRTVTGMIPGLNQKIGTLLTDVPPPPGMDQLYRKFWARAMLRIGVMTVIAQLMLNGSDESEEWLKEQALSNQFTRYRWTEVEITRLYELLGIDTEEKRKTFSLGGHFFDPLKLIDPWTLAKHKGSPLTRAAESFFSGSDWAGRPYTGAAEFLETGKTVKKSFHQRKEGAYDRLPATVVNQVVGMQPIQVGQAIRFLQGEEDGLSALMHSIGAATHNAYPPFVETPILSTGKAGSDVVQSRIQELRDAGALHMGPPSRTVTMRGITERMSREQYRRYVEESSALAEGKLAALMGSEKWEHLSPEKQAQYTEKIIRNARRKARGKAKRTMAREKRTAEAEE